MLRGQNDANTMSFCLTKFRLGKKQRSQPSIRASTSESLSKNAAVVINLAGAWKWGTRNSVSTLTGFSWSPRRLLEHPVPSLNLCRDGKVPSASQSLARLLGVLLTDDTSEEDRPNLWQRRGYWDLVRTASWGAVFKEMMRVVLNSTCRRHDVDPQRYLTQLLTNLSQVRRSEIPSRLRDR
jgi:hypothetical protein